MPILHPEVDAAPLGDLRALEERQLRNGLLVHASRSALYRARWREAGIDPGAIRTLEDLQRLCSLAGADALRAAHAAGRLPVEYILPSPTQAAVTLSFLADRRPTAVIGFPSL